jgi:hypothetical protein
MLPIIIPHYSVLPKDGPAAPTDEPVKTSEKNAVALAQSKQKQYLCSAKNGSLF